MEENRKRALELIEKWMKEEEERERKSQRTEAVESGAEPAADNCE